VEARAGAKEEGDGGPVIVSGCGSQPASHYDTGLYGFDPGWQGEKDFTTLHQRSGPIGGRGGRGRLQREQAYPFDSSPASRGNLSRSRKLLNSGLQFIYFTLDPLQTVTDFPEHSKNAVVLSFLNRVLPLPDSKGVCVDRFGLRSARIDFRH
jgi:hypothetical protein